MLIDWFTVGAQVLNFVILVWLLKHFLYQPILNAIDTREKRIAKERADADAIKSEAGKERDAFRKKNEDFDQHRTALLAKATEDAKAERQRLMDEASAAADALAAKRQAALQQDAKRLNQAITTRAEQEVFAVARKMLKDLINADLEDQLCAAFAHRLGELKGAPKAALAAAIEAATDPALVRTAVDLHKGQRQVIQDAFNATFTTHPKLRFEASPDLIGGVELTVGGQKLAWSIADYLATLEQEVDALLKAEGEAPPDAKANARETAKEAAKAKPAAKHKAAAT
jgi:F-type H+-transporting ATPase subunit b